MVIFFGKSWKELSFVSVTLLDVCLSLGCRTEGAISEGVCMIAAHRLPRVDRAGTGAMRGLGSWQEFGYMELHFFR